VAHAMAAWQQAPTYCLEVDERLGVNTAEVDGVIH
jgi:hypothetical protein